MVHAVYIAAGTFAVRLYEVLRSYYGLCRHRVQYWRGEQTSIQTLAELVRDVTDSNSDIVHTDLRPSDIDASVADITTTERDPGFEPRASLEAGLRTLV